jgi:nitrogen PTS system EIIA component
MKPEHVILSHASSKGSVIAELARLAGAQIGHPPAVIAQAVSAREELGSTGVGGGIALPHARIDGIEAPIGFFARLDRPVDWGSIDGKPVDLVFLLLSPPPADADHLAALAAMTRRLRELTIVTAIRNAAKANDIYRALAYG